MLTGVQYGAEWTTGEGNALMCRILDTDIIVCAFQTYHSKGLIRLEMGGSKGACGYEEEPDSYPKPNTLSKEGLAECVTTVIRATTKYSPGNTAPFERAIA